MREGDNVSFISLIFFRALKLSFINFFLGLLSLKDIDLEIDVFLRLLSLNRESVEITYSLLLRVLEYRFLDYLLGLLIDSSIGFSADYSADYLINILFLLRGRDFLNLRVILMIYYREK